MVEYTIHELAKLSGVTPRTLRWYDEIGLLKPSRIADNGYRCYSDKEVDRLQEILYYRALGVKLSQMKACLEAPSYHRLEALRSHLEALRQERVRIDRLIQSVQDSIDAEERNEHMSVEKKFEAFKRQMVDENERAYGKEARARYGDSAVNEANAAMMNFTQIQYEQWQTLGEEIQQRLEQAVTAGVVPQSDEGKQIAALHRQWLTMTNQNYRADQHRGIAQLYVLDERFTAYYDRTVPGCAQFLHDAVMHWIQ